MCSLGGGHRIRLESSLKFRGREGFFAGEVQTRRRRVGTVLRRKGGCRPPLDPIGCPITNTPRAVLRPPHFRCRVFKKRSVTSPERATINLLHIIAFGWTWDAHEEVLPSRTRLTMTCGGSYGRILRRISSTPPLTYSSAPLKTQRRIRKSPGGL